MIKGDITICVAGRVDEAKNTKITVGSYAVLVFDTGSDGKGRKIVHDEIGMVGDGRVVKNTQLLSDYVGFTRALEIIDEEKWNDRDVRVLSSNKDLVQQVQGKVPLQVGEALGTSRNALKLLSSGRFQKVKCLYLKPESNTKATAAADELLETLVRRAQRA